MGIIAVLWEKWREFRRDFYKITLAATITPLMYLIVFGLGIQTTSHGEPYLNFLVPGIVAMSTMTGSFSAVAQNMSVQRLYEKALDQVMVSPTPLWQFILGQVIGGSLRGMYAACIILLITMPIAADLTFNGWSFLVMFLNGLVFSTIALVLSFWRRATRTRRVSHRISSCPCPSCATRSSPQNRCPWGSGSSWNFCPCRRPAK